MTNKDPNSATLSRGDRDAWEKAEVERSEVEAREAEAAGIDRNEVNRYLSPAADSPYSLEFAFSLLGDLTGKKVLDFGCGSGENTIVLRAKGAHVLALDISPHLLAVTEKRLRAHGFDSGTEFLLASGHEMPIPPASLDVVFGAAILHHLDLAEAAAEVWRVLQPGGTAIFIEPVRDPKLYRMFRRLVPNRGADISPFEYPLSSHQLNEFSRSFEITARRRFILPVTTILAKAGISESIVKLFRVFDALLMRVVPSMQHWATVEVIQIKKPTK